NLIYAAFGAMEPDSPPCKIIAAGYNWEFSNSFKLESRSKRIRFASMSPQGPNMLLKKDGRKIPANSPAEHGTTTPVCEYGAQVLNYSECCGFP
ncbi:hypothetical protein STEG23_010086, partial [Scotinomys teguina]